MFSLTGQEHRSLSEIPRPSRRLASRFLAAGTGVLLIVLGGIRDGSGFAFNGFTWPSGSQISMHLNLNRPAVPLQDGFPSWNASAADALSLWNQNLGNVAFVNGPATEPASADGVNSVFFSGSMFGETFPPGVLAVTLSYSDSGNAFTETDVIFNSVIRWNSYRGPVQGYGASATYDLHRVALHEFGHVLGLSHPDEHGQGVDAIMNSAIGHLDHLSEDDIAGARELYGLRLTSATSAAGVAGEPFTFQLTANLPNVTFFSADLPAGLNLDPVTGVISGAPAAGGTFVVHFTLSRNGKSATASMTLKIKRAARPIQGVTGFTIAGEEQASPVGDNNFYYTPADGTFSVTGLADNPYAPALGTSVTFSFSGSGETWEIRFAAPRGVPLTVGRYEGLNGYGPFSHGPSMELIRGSSSSGGEGGYFEVKSIAYGADNKVLAFDAKFEMYVHSGSPIVRGEARFATDASNPPPTPVITSPLALQLTKGAAVNYKITATPEPTRYKVYHLPVGLSFDAATATITGVPLNTGNFDIVLGAENAAGTGTARLNLVIFAPAPPHTLQNIATRLFVGADADVAIAGVIITGSNPKPIIVRGVGPSLSAVGVNGVVLDPQLELRDGNGGVLGANDNWLSGWEAVHETGLPPSDRKEAAIAATISPGSYTAIMKGYGLSGTTGVGLLEVYDLDPTSGSRLSNISTRGRVKTGENVMIGGFIIGGDQPTKIVVRGIGPSLAAFGIPGVLPDPVITLHDAHGPLIQNNDWRENAEQISATGLAPANDREAAVVVTLAPGNYTAILQDSGGASGVGLIEIYNLDANQPSAP